jgi:hypothetical protein
MSGAEQDPEGGGIPHYQFATWTLIGITVVIIGGLFGVRTEHQPETTRDYPSRALIPDVEAVLLAAPEIDDEYLPCVDCHADQPTDREVRELEDEHEENEVIHGDIWCLHCHDGDNVGSLHLADDTLVDFEDSWRLCTQCHAKKLPDWRAGVHGKRTGHWRGTKEYRTCVVCHEPHAPAFAPLAPKPPPVRPEEITLRPSVTTSAAGGDDHGDS